MSADLDAGGPGEAGAAVSAAACPFSPASAPQPSGKPSDTSQVETTEAVSSLAPGHCMSPAVGMAALLELVVPVEVYAAEILEDTLVQKWVAGLPEFTKVRLMFEVAVLAVAKQPLCSPQVATLLGSQELNS